MKLNVLLRTCNRSENNPTMRRIHAVPRAEMILRCVRSLITALNQTRNAEVTLTIIDDSHPEFSATLEQLAKTSTQPMRFVRTPRPLTNNESMLFCYEYAKANLDGIIYFTEDDYLYFPHCFTEMVEAHEQFTKNLGGMEVALHPADSPLEYHPEEIALYPARIVLGAHRHWRTTVSATFTLLFSKELLVKYYQYFLDYSKFDGVKYHEASTINLIFRDQAVLFSPIPSLAFHLGYIDPPAPHVSHKELWEANASERHAPLGTPLSPNNRGWQLGPAL